MKDIIQEDLDELEQFYIGNELEDSQDSEIINDLIDEIESMEEEIKPTNITTIITILFSVGMFLNNIPAPF